MNHLMTFKIFESTFSYSPDDEVVIKYWLTGDMVPVKILSKTGNNYLVTFKVDGNFFQNAPDMEINGSQIVALAKSNASPAFPDPFNAEVIRAKSTQISNDIVINNYPKTI